MEEEKELEEKIKKIKNIVDKEIGNEIISKQNEVTEISEKIEKTLRHLEILKYVATVNYYEHGTSGTSKKSYDSDGERKEENLQTQIHPTVKKLLPFKSNYKKCFPERKYETRYKKTNVSDFGQMQIKKEIIDGKLDDSKINNVEQKIPQYIPPLPKIEDVKEKLNSSRGGLAKVKQRIIVGNISKWMPPDTREDTLTHKWMVYVRHQDKEKDVTSLIRKVRYFLHESYKPNDIIDVTSAPFHLTRRGWGEFPIRVQLHFHHPLDKPVDIIHSLKLDMTCSGVQVMGAETVVEVSLHDVNFSVKNPSPIKIKVEPEATKLEQPIAFDSLPLSENKKNGLVRHSTNKNDVLDRRKLLRVIDADHDYWKSPKPKYKNGATGIAQLLASNGPKVEALTSRNESEIFNSLKSHINRHEFSINSFKSSYWINFLQRVTSTKLNTVEGLLAWFFPRWPIITKLANDPIYKVVHPYSCPSEETFSQYNIGKQRSSEWFRAKAIQKILFSLKSIIPLIEEVWSTKQILLWSKFHGYSPMLYPQENSSECEPNKNKRLKFNDSSSDSEDESMDQKTNRNCKKNRRKREVPEPPKVSYTNISTYTDFHSDATRYGFNSFKRLESTEEGPELDVVNITDDIKESPKKKKTLLRASFSSEKNWLMDRLVTKTSRQIGVGFVEEEIVEGVLCNSAVRVVSAASAAFLEDLLRKSLAQAWLRHNDRAPSSIEKADVVAVLVEHPQFDIFTNRGLGKNDFHSSQ